MGACDYSIASMQNLKQDLMQIDAINPELNWAIGGIVATLVSNLIQICDQVFQEAVATGEPNAKQDLTLIKEQFGEFIDRMVNHE
jgi:uncharacterized glyoxalase superfamily protein PhnB